MMKLRGTLLGAALLGALAANAAEPRPDQLEFRALYKELVETDTAASTGSCTLAAERMAARLKAAGYSDSDLTLFSDPQFPKDGGLVAVLRGSDSKAKGVLLLAHIDVVEARREDWVRDPFTLIEEDGKFYGRGTTDDKTQAAIWTDTLVRLKKQGFKPKVTLKMALTCGEEGGGGGRFNGARWLTQNRRDLIDADFALNEGAGGLLDETGKPSVITIEAGEKTYRDYRLEVTNAGGHSSRPVKDNAIYHLAHALVAIENHAFPVQFTEGSRAYFQGLAKQQAEKGNKEVADAMLAMLKEPPDLKAAELVASRDPSWNATLRTTCVATMLDGGHAPNALPQRAGGNVNCRIFPGVTGEQIRSELAAAINDPAVKVTQVTPEEPVGAAPPLTQKVVGPAEKLMAEMWPGVPVLPVLQAGATDGRYLNAAGIPTYGIDGSFLDRELNHIHGLNEYAGVDSLYKDRDFLFRLVKIYAEGK
jgi:acetylornithine deacetylase/succinyl-diaminopimelate desuccinylase-like protein